MHIIHDKTSKFHEEMNKCFQFISCENASTQNYMKYVLRCQICDQIQILKIYDKTPRVHEELTKIF